MSYKAQSARSSRAAAPRKSARIAGGAAKAPKAAAKTPKAKSSKSGKPSSITKTQFVGELSAKTGMTKAQINSVLSALTDVVASELGGGRPIAIPGLVKITSVRKAATAARPGFHPLTKEPIMVKAKPARTVVKVRALKGLKDMV